LMILVRLKPGSPGWLQGQN